MRTRLPAELKLSRNPILYLDTNGGIVIAGTIAVHPGDKCDRRGEECVLLQGIKGGLGNLPLA